MTTGSRVSTAPMASVRPRLSCRANSTRSGRVRPGRYPSAVAAETVVAAGVPSAAGSGPEPASVLCGLMRSLRSG